MRMEEEAQRQQHLQPGPMPAGQQGGRQNHTSCSDSSTTIHVQQRRRQLVQVSGSALLPLPAEQAFDLITHPSNEKIFRHLDQCTHHKTVEDDGSGRVVVESGHVASWRMLALSGKLTTRMRIEQDFRSLQSHFRMLPSRFSVLRKFNGQWQVQPQPPERCAHLQSDGGSSGHCCLVSIRQELQPAVFMPPPLGGALKQLACKQLRGIFQDMQQEADRINHGKPTLW